MIEEQRGVLMRRLIAVLAVASVTVSPATASVRDAAFASSSDRILAQTSMFAGATYRVGFDGRSGKPRGHAAVQLSGMVMSANSTEIRFGQGLQITGGKTGKPALFLSGRDVGQLGDQARLSKGATVGLVVLGVVVVAGAVVALAIDARLDRQNVE